MFLYKDLLIYPQQQFEYFTSAGRIDNNPVIFVTVLCYPVHYAPQQQTIFYSKDVEITGPISATLYAASSAPDTDFTVALVDVSPDGSTHLVQEGIIRASFRDGVDLRSPIEPGKVYEYVLDLWATSYVVRAGHRIRVEVSSSNFDRYDRNPNTGNDFGLSAETVPATQAIYHSAKYPSRITLPVVP